jgi:hypothetical protein
MKSGDVVVLNFPFSDLSAIKARPAVIIAAVGTDDFVVCQVTTNAAADPYAVRFGCRELRGRKSESCQLREAGQVVHGSPKHYCKGGRSFEGRGARPDEGCGDRSDQAWMRRGRSSLPRLQTIAK